MLESKKQAAAPADLETCSPPNIKRKPAFDAPNWMSGCADEVLVSSLSLPGTHDSSAYTQPWPFVATQTMSISQQLDAGIRYLDLRCGIVHDIAEMVHGPRLLGLQLHKLLETIYHWLDVHPTEALVVQIKEDRKPEASTLHFAQVILDNISTRPDRWRTANTTPGLGDLRGKIQLFRRYTLPSSNTAIPSHSIGIDVTQWQDNPSTPFTIHTSHSTIQLTIQDHYSFSSPLPLPRLVTLKGGSVSSLLQQSSADPDPTHWYMNFTSAYEFNVYYQLTPKVIAVGGWYAFRWEEGINVRLGNWLRVRGKDEGAKRKRRLGIVAMDFPERGSGDLVELIVRSNFEGVAGEESRGMWMCWAVLLVVMAVSTAVVACCLHARTDLMVEVVQYVRDLGLQVKHVSLDTST